MSGDEKRCGVRITSDGTAIGTRVFFGGVEVYDIKSIEINKIELSAPLVTVKIEIQSPELDINILDRTE